MTTHGLEPRAGATRHEQVLLELLKDCWGPPRVRDEWRGVVLDWCEEHNREAWRLGLEWARESGAYPRYYGQNDWGWFLIGAELMKGFEAPSRVSPHYVSAEFWPEVKVHPLSAHHTDYFPTAEEALLALATHVGETRLHAHR